MFVELTSRRERAGVVYFHLTTMFAIDLACNEITMALAELQLNYTRSNAAAAKCIENVGQAIIRKWAVAWIRTMA